MGLRLLGLVANALICLNHLTGPKGGEGFKNKYKKTLDNRREFEYNINEQGRNRIRLQATVSLSLNYKIVVLS